MGENEVSEGYNKDDTDSYTEVPELKVAGRKDKRKAAKKEKRKKKRKEIAEMARREEEALLNDPEEQLRLQAEEKHEEARVERERKEFEERERKIMEQWESKRAEAQREEEERRRRAEEEQQLNNNKIGNENESDEDGWEYAEEGPPEIIWQGNEIIVRKKKVRVKKKDVNCETMDEDPNRPISNPLPPKSEVFADYNTSVLSAQQLLENVAQETPNFGTEQDKAHCPFHLKTGACRFGPRCSRIHFYPDKSNTFLIKNMYSGPGLAWEQDEGLECTDEEVEHAYEEFYEDVHTEFLKFGEIVNFKVCKNGSSHLRGNVYVHYKSLDSAVLAYQSVNGRYFAGKQVQCEFVVVTRWKVAICGEFMKSKLQTCSRGKICNFIHCFRNPGGDYEWADWDKPAPKYWLKKMAALFGYPDESGNEKQIERGSPRLFGKFSQASPEDTERYHSRRSRSRETCHMRSSRKYSEDDSQGSKRQRRHTVSNRKHPDVLDDKHSEDDTSNRRKAHYRKNGKFNRVSMHGTDSNENMHHDRDKDSSRHRQSNRNRRPNSSDDHWSDDDKRESAHTCTKQSPRSNSSEESRHKISSKSHGHRSKHSSGGDRLGGKHQEVEHDSVKYGNYSGSYRSDSRLRSSSEKLASDEESERKFHNRPKKSGKKDPDEGDVSRRYHKERSYHAFEYDDDASDVRGRWEPS